MVERMVESHRLRIARCPRHPQEFLQDGYCHACAWRAAQGLPEKAPYCGSMDRDASLTTLEKTVFVLALSACLFVWARVLWQLLGGG